MTRRCSAGETWAIVLAAGDGRRLSPLTRALYGWDVPKQYAVLAGGASLLQRTLERTAAVAPPSRTLVVVAAVHESLARAQVARVPGVEVVVQPRNLDTAPGILLPLARVLARDARARVVIVPSDHHVPRPAPLVAAARAGLEAAARGSADVTLLGVAPEAPETEYGWIVPGVSLEPEGGGGLRAVERFVEKPSAPLAGALLARGALWNTFVIVAQAASIWERAERLLGGTMAVFRRYRMIVGSSRDRAFLEAAYRKLAPGSFSREVLERTGDLAVIPVAGSGWCDWGSPERVRSSLAGTRELAQLERRIAHNVARCRSVAGTLSAVAGA